MASFHEDDDEGFDWEAAVREIDVACAQNAADSVNNSTANRASTSNDADFRETHQPFVAGKGDSFPSSSKQSTLDRFITGAGSNSNRTQREKEGNWGNGFRENGNNHYHGIGKGVDEGGDAEGRASFVKIDLEAAKTWIYPVNIPRRDYQFNITRTALFSNTLVALPTGLGKTLIAAVVMYNYFRWFPEGKIVFAAPSRPLVLQQIEACHNIVGIPQEWTIDLTGQTSPTKRAHYWKTKRVFFVTPQVLEKDIYSGSCLVNYLVCLVIDEAHRATGNYSYCVAVRELMAVPVELRILALTATPGSKQQTVQHIINNLQISALEYRSESDPDVIPYVHDRKIELIEVAMGNDAAEVNNLILDVIRPYIARLGAIGVLPSRDFQTLSPCDLLNSRDKFRQAPPQNLPQTNYGEVEGYFGVLITLYHIRKLLSSHGIKPAFEMLQEKLQQGSFARLMSRNEILLKAKLVMQQNISHGAPSPKLSKMLEVLSDHFKTKSPVSSRVIIFSNFRGSVRDIMIALKNIEFVKATEFIGQSSGKTSKGQSQKMQQAVLEKFRAGGYNVIVATSIGEEGLDIMEVDLVICFDANVSPLRMIQRMGRTGRKHEGRVVVLACEGSELRGYMRKQANSKAIRKHMQNGGTKSFQFHSSPRMIPHILKPEVQFVELCIEQYVPRAKKINDDDSVIDSSTYKTKLTNAEKELIAKYFCPSSKNTWIPSLIAFPHFQAFPSRVGKVVHSHRTGMLIDAMQCLQGLSFSGDTKSFLFEDRTSPEPSAVPEAVEQCHETTIELTSPINFHEADREEVLGAEIKAIGNISTEGEPFLQDSQQKTLTHCFLFNSEFVALDDLGRVMVLSLPEFPLREVPILKLADSTTVPHHRKEASVNFDPSSSTHLRGEKYDLVEGMTASTSQMRSQEDDNDRRCNVNNICHASQERTLVLQNLQTSSSKQNPNVGENICSSPQTPPPIDEGNNDSGEFELSPRLTNFLESGVVPESPIINSGRPSIKDDGCEVSDLVSNGMDFELVEKFQEQGEEVVHGIHGDEMNVQSPLITEIQFPATNVNEVIPALKSTSPTAVETRSPFINVQSPLIDEIQVPAANVNEVVPAFNSASPTAKDSRSPLINLVDTSCSEDWLLNSGDRSKCVEEKPKLKRLRKLGELSKNGSDDLKGKTNGLSQNLSSHRAADHLRNHHERGKRRKVDDAKLFVEEEAEVSSDVGVSADEEDELDNNSFDDSFIDDRLNPTATSTQAEEGAVDMMAVYRRSLLSQSPSQIMPNSGADTTPCSEVRTNESTSTSGTESHLLQKSCSVFGSTTRPNRKQDCSDRAPSGTTGVPEDYGSKTESSKKRKFFQPGSFPVHNLEQEFSVQSMHLGEDSIREVNKFPEDGDIFDDDQFFDAIDLDAIEEEATKLLKQRTECSTQKHVALNNAMGDSPSFDLGI